jgi:hypothetical protein
MFTVVAALPQEVLYLFGLLLSGSFVTAMIALLKVKPEKDAVVVTAAQGALVVQTGVLRALEAQLDRETKARQLAEEERDIAEKLTRQYKEVLRANGIDPGTQA